jgi:hypothetical protein
MDNRLSGHLLQAEKEPLVQGESGGLGESVFKAGPIRGFSANQGSIDIKNNHRTVANPRSGENKSRRGLSEAADNGGSYLSLEAGSPTHRR